MMQPKLKSYLDSNPKLIIKTRHLRLVVYREFVYNPHHIQAKTLDGYQLAAPAWIIQGYTIMDLDPEEKRLLNLRVNDTFKIEQAHEKEKVENY